jgi:hypothetical protein
MKESHLNGIARYELTILTSYSQNESLSPAFVPIRWSPNSHATIPTKGARINDSIVHISSFAGKPAKLPEGVMPTGGRSFPQQMSRRRR